MTNIFSTSLLASPQSAIWIKHVPQAPNQKSLWLIEQGAYLQESIPWVRRLSNSSHHITTEPRTVSGTHSTYLIQFMEYRVVWVINQISYEAGRRWYTMFGKQQGLGRPGRARGQARCVWREYLHFLSWVEGDFLYLENVSIFLHLVPSVTTDFFVYPCFLFHYLYYNYMYLCFLFYLFWK